MNEINVYDFCQNLYEVSKIKLHLWSRDEKGKEICKHVTLHDKNDRRLFEYRGYEISLVSVPEKNCIDIVATNY